MSTPSHLHKAYADARAAELRTVALAAQAAAEDRVPRRRFARLRVPLALAGRRSAPAPMSAVKPRPSI